MLSLLSLNAPAQQCSELKNGWKMISASQSTEDGSVISNGDFVASKWYDIKNVPRTILAVLQDNGVYTDLYYAKNLEKVPDLYKQEWWYRKEFTLPDGNKQYWLKFAGISYRAELWVNGKIVADNKQMVGTYSAFEYNISNYVKTGKNVLALKIRPDQTDNGQLELGEFWVDWIGNLKVPDRNGGIWQPVYLKSTGPVEIKNPMVITDLPLPDTTSALLTVVCDIENSTSKPQNGVLKGVISCNGKPDIVFQKKISLKANQQQQIKFSPTEFKQLFVSNPDLWWPYTLGKPSLYSLKLSLQIGKDESDAEAINFGIREVERGRDTSNENYMYLKVNGYNYLVRGGCYSPDLLFRQDSATDRTMIKYIKDMGLNFLRFESKMGNPYFYDLCDREGIPYMIGWVCCGQWEDWQNWDAEDHAVALQGVKAQIMSVRHRPAAFMWAHASDGRPPENVLNSYHEVLKQTLWPNPDVDQTLGNSDGIHMLGPYTTRPPYFWFSSAFKSNQGFCAEQGDNECVPPYKTLKKFIPEDKLWPLNDTWLFHTGQNGDNRYLLNVENLVKFGFGSIPNAKDFCDKAQIFHYANTRAQFEAFAARGWATHKGTIYWMLGTHWPSFFGNIVNNFYQPGGSYFGAKKGLQPLNVVYDYYAEGDRKQANIYVYNQTIKTYKDLNVRVRFINLDNTTIFDSKDIIIKSADPLSTQIALKIDRKDGLDPVWFVKCELKDNNGNIIQENVYWQSKQDDLVLDTWNIFTTIQTEYGNYQDLNKLPKVNLDASVSIEKTGIYSNAKVLLTNNSKTIAFFTRVEITSDYDGEEVIPITYSDNYITLFPGESKTITATFETRNLKSQKPFLGIEGFNVVTQIKGI